MNVYSTGLTGTIGKHLPPSVKPIDLNLLAPIQSFRSIDMASNSVVIHLAAVVGEDKVLKHGNLSESINVLGSEKLGKICIEKNIKKLIYISTSHVYNFSDKFLTEESLIQPISNYAKQKYMGEIALQSMYSNTPEKLCIVRVFSLLDWNMPDFTLGGSIQKLLKGGGEFKLKYGKDVRDFLTPRQTAKAIFSIAKNKNVFGIVNLCSSDPLSVYDAAVKLLGKYGTSSLLDAIENNISEIPRIVGCNLKIKSIMPTIDLTWKPTPMLQYARAHY